MKILFFALLTASDDAQKLVGDALAAHTTVAYVVAALAACLFLLPIVLKARGITVPFLDPIMEGLIQLLKGLIKAVPAPTPEELKAKADETAKEPGVAGVAKVVEFKPPEKP